MRYLPSERKQKFAPLPITQIAGRDQEFTVIVSPNPQG